MYFLPPLPTVHSLTHTSQAIVEIPCFGLEDFVAAYLPDPDTKFILTTRDPAAWARSWSSTIGMHGVAGERFPIWQLRSFDRFLDEMFTFINIAWRTWSRGKGNDEDGRRESEGYCVE
jgi:hypothetical protein